MQYYNLKHVIKFAQLTQYTVTKLSTTMLICTNTAVLLTTGRAPSVKPAHARLDPGEMGRGPEWRSRGLDVSNKDMESVVPA